MKIFATPSHIALLLATWMLGPAAAVCRAADGQLALTVVDEKTHKPIPCRMHLVGPGKLPRKIDQTPFYNDHFVFPGKITLKLPMGHYTFVVQRGPEYLTREGYFTIERFADDQKDIELRRFVDVSEEGWWSGDLHLRRPLHDMQLLMTADDLHVAQVLTWWDAKTDAHDRSLVLPPDRRVTFDTNRVYEVLAGGFTCSGNEVLCFHLPRPLLWPAEATGDYPSLVQHLAPLRPKQPSDEPAAWVDVATSYSRDLPVLVAHGQVDSIEVANSHFCRSKLLGDEAGGRPRNRDFYAGPFGYARWVHDIYFKLLDCGLRIPPSAGSGSGVTPNPVGYNRVYVHLDGEFNYDQWWRHLRAGEVVVSNGPLLRPKVDGYLPGHVFHGEPGKELELEIGLTLSTCDPLSYLEIVQNGVVHSIRFSEYAESGRLPKVKFKQSGWFLLRAVCDVSDTYRFAMSGPFYVEFGDRPRVSKKAAQFFLDWVFERARQLDIEDAAQRREVLALHRQARDFWQDLVTHATAE